MPQYTYKLRLAPIRQAKTLAALAQAFADAGETLPEGVRARLAQLKPGESVLTPDYSIRRTDELPPPPTL